MTLVVDPEVLAGDWSVWDRHLRTWLAVGYGSEQEAWKRLLEIDSLHPWELTIQKVGQHGKPFVKCSKCDGDGECWNCEVTCPECDGTGEVEDE